MMFVNDTQYLDTYFLISIWLLLVLFCCLLWHELGHMLYFKYKLKKDIKLYFKYYSKIWFKTEAGKREDYQDTTDDEYIGINVSGVLLGLVPLIVLHLVNALPFPILLMLIPYATSIQHDLKIIIDDMVKEKNKLN